MLTSGVSIRVKAYLTIGLVALAVFEFITAMYVYGRRGSKPHARAILALHRGGGYAFLVCWLWPMAVGADLLTRLSRYQDGWSFDGPRFFHALLGVVVLALLLLKVLCVRLFTQFRESARVLGIVVTVTALVTWVISGLFWFWMMGSARLE